MKNKKRIAIGLSGGVDSSVAAYILLKKGWDVTGFTLKFYPKENRCCDLDSLYQAQRLCHRLGIAHYVLDVSYLFKQEIINYFISNYLKGLTPNPCVYCNRNIKFGIFLKKVQSFGFEHLATGHYVRVIEKKGKFAFRRSKDLQKTQEYFLSLVKPHILKNLVFPLGGYTKSKVKKIAKDNKVMFYPREESQDVCFIGNGNYPEFIEESISEPHCYRGKFKHINGEILGDHKGIYRYTYGQRSGLGISWSKPLYVVKIDLKDNSVILGEKMYLWRDSFFVHSLNWFFNPEQYKNIKVQIRYNSPAKKCSLKVGSRQVEVCLKERVDSVAPGQIAAFYSKDILLGAGTIAI